MAWPWYYRFVWLYLIYFNVCRVFLDFLFFMGLYFISFALSYFWILLFFLSFLSLFFFVFPTTFLYLYNSTFLDILIFFNFFFFFFTLLLFIWLSFHFLFLFPCVLSLLPSSSFHFSLLFLSLTFSPVLPPPTSLFPSLIVCISLSPNPPHQYTPWWTQFCCLICLHYPASSFPSCCQQTVTRGNRVSHLGSIFTNQSLTQWAGVDLQRWAS